MLPRTSKLRARPASRYYLVHRSQGSVLRVQFIDYIQPEGPACKSLTNTGQETQCAPSRPRHGMSKDGMECDVVVVSVSFRLVPHNLNTLLGLTLFGA